MEESFRLTNQFRGLDESESQFLADLAHARMQREQAKRREDASELEAFRRCVFVMQADQVRRKVRPPLIPCLRLCLLCPKSSRAVRVQSGSVPQMLWALCARRAPPRREKCVRLRSKQRYV